MTGHAVVPAALDEAGLARAVTELSARDRDLAAIVQRHGTPPLWAREPGFATLVHIILEQQVSLASAQAAFDRLVAAIGRPSPDAILRLTDAELLGIGFSRQKARYVRLLSARQLDGSFDVDMLDRLEDDAARDRLVGLTGIGPWTADIYLLMALRRPDVWPTGDLALVTALAAVKHLPVRPSGPDAIVIAEAWRPWRAVAARILWHDYLARRGRR